MASPSPYSSASSPFNNNTSDSSFSRGGGNQLVIVTDKDVTPNDVLCGRGQGMYNHPGNSFFRSLVDQRRDMYLKALYKCEKRVISDEIVQSIHNQSPPGRFLARLTGGKRRSDSNNQLASPEEITWYEVSYEKAREKACQSLREKNPPQVERKTIKCARRSPSPMPGANAVSNSSEAASVSRSSPFSGHEREVQSNSAWAYAAIAGESSLVNEAASSSFVNEAATTASSSAATSNFTEEEINLLLSLSQLPSSTPSPPSEGEVVVNASTLDPPFQNERLSFLPELSNSVAKALPENSMIGMRTNLKKMPPNESNQTYSFEENTRCEKKVKRMIQHLPQHQWAYGDEQNKEHIDPCNKSFLGGMDDFFSGALGNNDNYDINDDSGHDR